MIDRSFPAAAWMLAAVVAVFMEMTSGTMAQGPSTTGDGLPVRIPIASSTLPQTQSPPLSATPSVNSADRNLTNRNSAASSTAQNPGVAVGTGGTVTPSLQPPSSSATSAIATSPVTTSPVIPAISSTIASISSTVPQNVSVASEDNSAESNASWNRVMAQATAATVRIRVLDATGHSWGTGTIVDARNHRALIVTCGHIFRESQGKGEIQIDFFHPVERRVAGTLITYDLESDIGLLAVELTEPVVIAPIAAASTPIKQGMRLFSVGCNHGEKPSVMQGYLSAQNRYEGPANLTASGVPVEGRSGGGLFDASGRLIGICQAAVPTDNEGLYGAWTTLIEKLDSIQLAAIYQSPQNDSNDLAQSATATALAQTPATNGMAVASQTPLANRSDANQSSNLWHANDESETRIDGTTSNTSLANAERSTNRTVPSYLASGVRITDFEENSTGNLYTAHTATNIGNSVPTAGTPRTENTATGASFAQTNIPTNTTFAQNTLQEMPQDMPLPNSVVRLTNADSRGVSTLSDRRAPDAISRMRNESKLRSTQTSGTSAQTALTTSQTSAAPTPNFSDSPLKTLSPDASSTHSDGVSNPNDLEVVCIIRPRNEPEGKSEIVRIESPSAELLAEIGRAKSASR